MIKMGHVLEASVEHHYQKIWEVTPSPPPPTPTGRMQRRAYAIPITHPHPGVVVQVSSEYVLPLS